MLTQLSQLKILFIDFFGHLHDFGFFFQGMLGKEGSDVSIGVFGGVLLEGRVSVWVLILVSFLGAFFGSVPWFLAFKA